MKNLKIPRAAVQPLTELCVELSREWNKPADGIFEEFLELMMKYSDFFFSKPFPEALEKPPKIGYEDDEEEFLSAAKTYRDECGRFLLVCLRRNMSMKGVDKEGFLSDYRFYGGFECKDCLVPEAMRLRKKWKEYEELKRKVDEEVQLGNPSEYARVSYEHLREPSVTRYYKMLEVKLWLFEEESGVKGKEYQVYGPYVYGFRIFIGPDGKPKIEEFGNVRRISGKPVISEEREPLVDVFEEGDEIVVIAELPGVDKDKINIKVGDNMRKLVIRASDTNRKYYKEIELPAKVDPKSAKANYRNGVLEIKLRKVKAEEKGFEIKVE